MSGDHTKYHGTAEVPKREWVGLTDDEILDLWCNHVSSQWLEYAKAVEAKLKERNSA